MIIYTFNLQKTSRITLLFMWKTKNTTLIKEEKI